MRSVVTCVAVLAAFAGSAVALGAGTATAVDPIDQHEQARVGAQLSHAETEWLGSGPIPALITMFVPLNRIGAGLQGDSQIYRDQNGGVHASLRQVITEAASHPNGTVTVYVNAPGTRDGRVLDIYQHWG